jgi:hypothetical protein
MSFLRSSQSTFTYFFKKKKEVIEILENHNGTKWFIKSPFYKDKDKEEKNNKNENNKNENNQNDSNPNNAILLTVMDSDTNTSNHSCDGKSHNEASGNNSNTNNNNAISNTNNNGISNNSNTNNNGISNSNDQSHQSHQSQSPREMMLSSNSIEQEKLLSSLRSIKLQELQHIFGSSSPVRRDCYSKYLFAFSFFFIHFLFFLDYWIGIRIMRKTLRDKTNIYKQIEYRE